MMADNAAPTIVHAETWQHHRARLAVLSRYRRHDDPDLIEAKLDLREARMAEWINRQLAERPPLSDAQRDRLASMLAPVRRSGALR